MATTEPIAIVGMAGRFPGSDNIEEFWANLVAGRDCLTELSDEELRLNYEPPGRLGHPDYVRRRPLLADSDALDGELFGIPPREAELRDPQYRILLETVHAVLEHAGYDPSGYGGHIGLFAATNANRYRYDHVESNPDVVESVGWGAIDIHNNADYLTTYISYKLGLRGPSATVLTACSSSLVTVHIAANAIRSGDCDMAVAGGVDIEFPFHRGYIPIPGGMWASDGVLRPFDANSTGTNFGDGVGAVLLKPLSAAIRDNDTIYATILASAINNDGARKVGYTAPSIAGQSECISKALRNSGVQPADIGYLEAHGTATRVGDPIEVAGLIDAYRMVSPTPLPAQYCGIGTVKSNVGHLGQAAGVAALIKATLALVHEKIPPSIGLSTPNPEVDWANSPFYVNTQLREWPADPCRPRHAGVSSFGIGGTNAHLVLQEAPAVPPRPGYPRSEEIVTWSAMNAVVETALRERLAAHFDGLDEDRFADTAYTLRVGRTRRPVRAALAATGAADAAGKLRDPDRVWTWDGVPRDTVFAFPGQGAQFPGMCRQLYDSEPMFQQGCDAAFEVLEPLLGRDLRALWQSATDPAQLAETEVTQPLLYVLEYTLAHCLMHWGVTPSVLIGHSLGELVAAAVAGVFDFEAGLRAVAARAQYIQRMPRGRMLAAAAGRDAVADLLTDEVALAAVNGPDQVVLAGPEPAIRDVAEKLTARGVTSRELTTSHAFHSPAMAQAAAQFQEMLAELVLSPPTIPLVSAATGAAIRDDQAISAAFWARQLVEPVDFDAAATAVLADGPMDVVEVGPGTTLAALLRGRPDVRAAHTKVLPAVGRQADHSTLEETLAKLWVDGTPVTYWRQDEQRGYRRVAAPGYPYQRRRYWLDMRGGSDPGQDSSGQDNPAQDNSAQDSSAPQPVAQPVLAEPAGTPPAARWRLAELEWYRDRVPSRSQTAQSGSAVLLLPRDERAARAAQAAVQRAGYRTVRVVDSRAGEVAGRTGIDPTDPDAWLELLDKAAERTAGPVLLAHAALLDAPGQVDLRTLDDQLATGLSAVHGALKAAAVFQRRRGLPTRVLVLGRGMVDVVGDGRVNPATAAVLALLRTAGKELPGVPSAAIDVGEAVAEGVLSESIARAGLPLVALRGATRWLPRLKPLPDTEPEAQLRHRGTYLITGGLGGIGLVIARTLAETGHYPNLALLGRTPVAELDNRASIEAELAAIADAGAQVEVFTGDVGDIASLRRVIDSVQERFGPVNGVVHAAGVAGGGLLERLGTADMRRVMHPKTAGVLAIEEVFAARAPLDFLLLFSSAAALNGLFGSADYAAGNAFLDAHSLTRTSGERRTISIQWRGWEQVGMLARSASGRVALARSSDRPAAVAEPAVADAAATIALEVTRAAGRDWEFDEHIFDGVPVLPGTTLLELAVLGARTIREDWPLELRDVVFLAPVVGDHPRDVRVLLRPIGQEHRVIVQSRIAGSTDPWTEHATGTLHKPEPVTAPDLPDIRDRLPAPTDAPLADWIRFGPRWETMADVRGDADERLVRLVLAERFHADLAEHPLHPAIVDVAAGVLHDLIPGRQFAPFIYRKVVVLAPLTADVQVHSRFAAASGQGRRPVNFDIYDTATGRLLARMESFAMREVDAGQGFGTAAQRGPARADGSPPDELFPDEGAAVFLDILGRAHPSVVLVDLLGAELAPTGIPWADQAAEPVRQPQPAVAAPATAPPSAEHRPSIMDQRAGDGLLTTLSGLWAAALGIENIGADDDFFEVGGNSLGAVQLISRINAHFGTDLGAGALFDTSTIRSLADELKSLGVK